MQQRYRFCGALALAACLHGVADGRDADGMDAIGPAAGPVAAMAAAGAVPNAVPAAAPAAGVDRPVPGEAADTSPFSARPLAADRLDQLRGGTDTVWNDMKLSGAVTGNTAINVATGINTITNGSFSNASGLPVAIQNSGANVLIQNATIINVQLQ